jgi:hypothetical protein
MRTVSIDIKNTSQADRIKLYDYLKALGEPIYSETGLRDPTFNMNYFDFSSSNAKWSAGTFSNSVVLSIDQFIERFPLPFTQPTTEDPKDYAIICKDSSLEDRKTIYNYLEQLGHKMYKGTNFNSNKEFFGSPSTFYYNGEWSVGSCSNPRITATDFIAKFIKPVETTPEKEPEMDIKVGDVYKNSSGNLNTITRIVSHDYIYYTVSTGREYHTKLSVIQRNWKKVLQPATDQSTSIPKYLDRTNIRTGDYVERTEKLSGYTDLTPAFVAKTKGRDEISLVGSSQGFWDMRNFKVINHLHPSHPNYVNPDCYTSSSEIIVTSTAKVLQPLTEYLKTNSIKVGDVLKINTDLERHHSTNSSMYKLAGKLVSIASNIDVSQ